MSYTIKKAIANDWINEFPNLLAYTQNKLYKVVGPFIIGFEIFNLPGSEDYRPYFVIYGLWEKGIKECLKESAVQRQMKDRKGFQFDIPYLKHEIFFKEVVESTREQVRISFNGDVSLKSLYKIIDHEFLYILVISSPVNQAKLYTYKLFAALYVNNTRLVDAVLKEIKRASEKWEPQYFDWKYGNFATWYKSLEEKVNHRDEFLAQIQMNKEEDKLKKLNFSELVDL